MVLLAAPLTLATTAIPSPEGEAWSATGAPWGAWRLETADAGHACSYADSGNAVDSQGVHHIVYTRHATPTTGCAAIHAKRTLTGWEHTILSTPGESSYAGGIAIDAQDRPHVAYGWAALWYATPHPSGDGTWIKEKVEQGTQLVYYMSIAVGPDGTPHIVYSFGSQPLRHAWRDAAGVWHTEQVTTEGAYNTAVRVDSLGRVHAMWEPRGDIDGPYYGVREPVAGAWALEEDSQIPGCGFHVSLDLDSKDRPHAACHGPLGGLWYLHKDASGEWLKEQVAPKFNRGYDVTIAVDSKDNPHLAYAAWSNSPPATLYYASRSEATEGVAALGGTARWVEEVVDPSGEWPAYAPSLALDRFDRPHIVYYYKWIRMGIRDPLPYQDIRVAEPVAATALGPADPARVLLMEALA